MKSILLREINSFFGSPTGYLAIAVFLLINGLFLWVFDGQFNILQSGFADLSPFFTLAPWILLFLIPAITMKSFSEEKRQGTLELLLTKPLLVWQIVFGKFLGAMILILIALAPTLLYIAVLEHLSMFAAGIDIGSTLGSYFGMMFLIAAFTAIGVFTSAMTENQAVSFIVSVFVTFLLYFGFEAMAGFFAEFSSLLSFIGMESHFRSIGRGVIDTRDVVYFISICTLFLSLTVYKLKSMRS
jgi:ABC-2 type transport system permease protein